MGLDSAKYQGQRRSLRFRRVAVFLLLFCVLMPTRAKAYPFAIVTEALLANTSNLANSRSPINCTGLAGGSWVAVPGNSVYGNDSFCVSVSQLVLK